MIMHIANVAFMRDNAPEALKWKQIGSLWYDEDSHSGKIHMIGFRFGMAVATPFYPDTAPYIQGEITSPLPNCGKMFVGMMWTSENGIYSLRLECLPIIRQNEGYVTLDVQLDSRPGYVEHGKGKTT